MELKYTVSKEKGGQYYVHFVGNPNIPLAGSYGDKKKALHFAANAQGITYKEYMKLRKKEESNDC